MSDDDDNKFPATVLYPDAFKRSLPAGFDGTFDWSRWAAAINLRGISPMDIDACVEINNFFLIAETKDHGKTIPTGQRITMAAFVRSGLATVIYQWGKTTAVEWQYETWIDGLSPMFSAQCLCPWTAGQTPPEQIFDFIEQWSKHHAKLDGNAWRRRLVDAALHECSTEFRQGLIERLRRENREALGPFVETPLGKHATEI